MGHDVSHAQGAVHTILIVVAAEEQVTILVSHGAVAVVTIFPTNITERDTRNFALKLGELSKERTGKVERPTEVKTVPTVAIPMVTLINFKWLIFGVDGDDILSGKIALTPVEDSFATEG